MSKGLEEQKDFLIDAVLDLKQKADALDYLIRKLDEKEVPEVKLTLELFDNLLEFVYLLLWDNVVVTLYWIYDHKGQRGLIWYLNQIRTFKHSEKKVDEQIAKIQSLSGEIKKVKKFRDKWIAHRDKEPLEKYDEFWKKEARLTIKEVETLSDTAFEIIREHYPVTDLTNSGIHIPFLLSEVLIKESFVSNLRNWGLLNQYSPSLVAESGLRDYAAKENSKKLNMRDIEIINANADLINKQVEETLEFQAEW